MFAKRLMRAVAVAMVTFAAAVASGVAGAYEDEVSVTEYITLPKFCWYQFSGGTAQGSTPDYVYSNCGGHMNHYCDGLLDLQRSKKAKTPDQRRMLLRSARTNTRYTLNGLNQDGAMATCSITPHVQATMRDIDLQMRIYNLK